jgi:glutamate-1-semialdehyde 2,1-aminomutase
MPIAPEILDRYRQYTPRSCRLFSQAVDVLAGGVTHSSRFWDPYPIYVKRAKGSKIFDVDQNEYVDYWLANGTMFVGHNHPAVVSAVKNQLQQGSQFGLSSVPMLKLAQKINEMVPCAEKIRFTNSGTEAVYHALRIARGYTHRMKVAKFEGNYHGMIDELWIAFTGLGSGPECAGIPESSISNTLVLPFNDIDATLRLIGENEHELSCVILEPVPHDVIPPDPEFLKALREVTETKGIVLIFDEVVTGFRLAPGGAQEYYGVTPDIATLGKIAGGGFPFGAVVGRSEIMDITSPMRVGEKRVDIFGTYSGNPATMAAGLATLSQLENGEAQRYANSLGKQLHKATADILEDDGIIAQVTSVGSIFNVHFGVSDPVTNPRVAWRADRDTLYNYQMSMINEGIFMKPGARYARVSAAHRRKDIELTIDKIKSVLGRLTAKKYVTLKKS